jgi:SRSO17 transposase
VTKAIGWENRFERFLEPFLDEWRYKKRRQWAPVYLKGLLLPGERKSIEPLAERIAPGERQQLHHFVCEAEWDMNALLGVLWEQADRMVGGERAVLIVDDTALPKKGDCSVGVTPQYCGALGKKANCQSLVTLTLASNDVPVPLVLQLYLPEDWATDVDRRAKACVPDKVVFRPKWQIALDEVVRVKAAGVRFSTVLADAGYGVCSEFREALSAMGLQWAVGILCNHRVYPADVTTRMPRPSRHGGKPRKHPIPNKPVMSTAEAIEQLGAKAFRTVSWRTGTKGPMRGKFAARRVRLGDGGKTSRGEVLPGREAWLVCERRKNEDKYYVTSHDESTPLVALVRAIKARWSCEQAHQQLKEELGLDHFEGRSWRGLHQHALLTLVAFAFLQKERLREKKQAA